MKKTTLVFLIITLLSVTVFSATIYQNAVKILDSKQISSLDKTISYYYLFKNRSIGLTHAEPGMMYKENYRLLISMDLKLTGNPDKDLPYLIAYAYHSEPFNYVNRNPSPSESLLAFKPYYDYRLNQIKKLFDSYILSKLQDPSYKWQYDSFSSYVKYLDDLINTYRNDGKTPEANLSLIKDKLDREDKDYVSEVDNLSISVYSHLEKRRRFDWVSFVLMIAILIFVFDYFVEKKYNLLFASILAFLLVISLFTGSLVKFNTFNAISGFTTVFLLLISFIVWVNSSKRRWVWYVSLLFVLILILSFVSIDFNNMKLDSQQYFVNSTYFNLYKEHLVGQYSKVNSDIAFLKSIESKEQNEVRSLIFKSVAGFTRDFVRMGAIKEVKVFRNNIRIVYNRPMKGIEPDRYDLYTRTISMTGKFYQEFLKNSSTRHNLIYSFESSINGKVSRAVRYLDPKLKLLLLDDLQSRLDANTYEKNVYLLKLKPIIDNSKEHGLDFMPVQLKSGMTFLIVMIWLFIASLIFKRNRFIPMIFAFAAVVISILILIGFNQATIFEQYDFSLFSFNWQSFISSFALWYLGLIYALIIIVITFLKGVHL